MSAAPKLGAVGEPQTAEQLRTELAGLRNELTKMRKEEARLEVRAAKLRELVLGNRR